MHRNPTHAAVATLGALALACAGAADQSEPALSADATMRSQPIELGTIRWERDLEAARTRAAKTERDLLMLFQEVPG